jgi:hypothetical protein
LIKLLLFNLYLSILKIKKYIIIIYINIYINKNINLNNYKHNNDKSSNKDKKIKLSIVEIFQQKQKIVHKIFGLIETLIKD